MLKLSHLALLATWAALVVAVPLDETSPEGSIPRLASRGASILARQGGTVLAGMNTGMAKLTFDASGSFKVGTQVAFQQRSLTHPYVLSLSDSHFGERAPGYVEQDWGAANDIETQRVHGAIIGAEKPNYVVLNGDMVSGENIPSGALGSVLAKVYAAAGGAGVPFSSTGGNHDNANFITHKDIIDYERANFASLSYTRSDAGPSPWGLQNYWVPVFAKADSTKPALVLWFLDSQNFTPGNGGSEEAHAPEGAGIGNVDPSVAIWIKSQSEAMQTEWGSMPPSAVFVHQPFSITRTITTLLGQGTYDDNPFSVQGEADQAVFDAVAALPNVLAVVSGHDHGNTWCGVPPGQQVTMCFNGHSGYGGYKTANTMVRNGRVLSFNLEILSGNTSTVETWSAYEDGSVKDKLTV